MWTYTTDSMGFVTVSTGLILPYWMGLPIRYIQSEIANISGLPYEKIEKEQLKDYLDMTVLRVDQDWNITIG